MKVLVIDDEAAFGSMIQRYLARKGLDAIVVQNIKSAMEELECSDFILSDINLDGENGIEFIQSLRADGVNIPAILMSGLDTDYNKQKALELTGNPLICKPVDFDILFPIIQQSQQPFTTD